METKNVKAEHFDTNNYMFYDIMNYPIPNDKELFFLSMDVDDKPGEYNFFDDGKFSWKEKSLLMDDFILFVNKYGFLYKSLPYVKAIYLCNSMSFNALKETSDIDLFLITKKNRLWIARFWSVVLFWLWRIKRHKDVVSKKFCLSFYVTEEEVNLYNISVKPFDLYLIYWIAHLVPLYLEDMDFKNEIYKKNSRIKNFLINFTGTNTINLGNQVFTGNTFFKNLIQKLHNKKFGDFVERSIKFFWFPIILWKNKKLGHQADGVNIGKTHLKFHGNDIRKKVNLVFKMKRGR